MRRRTTIAEEAQAATARAESNDMDLVQAVIRTAIAEGYTLVGPSRHAYRLVDGPDIERVPTYESDMVHQLLVRGLLKEGGTRVFSHGGREGPGRSVLVPKSTRSMASRWGAFRPLSSPRAGHIRDADTGRAARHQSIRER